LEASCLFGFGLTDWPVLLALSLSPIPCPPRCTLTGIELGSGKPNKEKVGKVTKAQIEEIAKIKLPDTNATKVESVMLMVEGTAKNMGITVE
jgi:hypothetical protein